MGEPAEHAEIVDSPCPECGMSAQVRRHIPKRWLERAVLIPTVIWAFLIIGLLVYTSPWAQEELGNKNAFASMQKDTANGHVQILSPVVRAGLMVDYPDQAEVKISESLEALSKTDPSRWSDSKYRFVFLNQGGSATHNYQLGLINPWFKHDSSTMLQRLHLDSSGRYRFDYPSESVYAGYYNYEHESTPELLTVQREVRLHGAQLQTRSVLILNYIEVVLTLSLLALFVLRLLAICGVQRFRDRRCKFVVMLTLIMGFTIFGLTSRVEQHSVSTHIHPQYPDLYRSDWFDEELMSNFVYSDDNASVLLEFLQSLAINSPPNAVLGYEMNHAHETMYTEHNALYTGSQQIWSYFHAEFKSKQENGTTIPADRCGRYPAGLHISVHPQFHSFKIAYGGLHSDKGVQIYWTRVVFMATLLWFALRALRLAGSSLAYRTQRKRIKRDQCIFCGYPLSPEALTARSGFSGS